MHIERSGSQSYWTNIGNMLASLEPQHILQAPMAEPARCQDGSDPESGITEVHLQSASVRT